MRPLIATFSAALLAGTLFANSALADDWSFAESQRLSDNLFQIDVGGSYSGHGQGPRSDNSGIGTIKVSLPDAAATFDPVAGVAPSDYSCTTTTSTYGQAGTGYVCSADGQPEGTGIGFPTAVTLHLLSQTCYAPPAQDAAQPALIEIWVASSSPGTAPDMSFPITFDAGCEEVLQEVVSPSKPLRCLIPNVKRRTLAAATRRLKLNSCRRGRVRYAPSSTVGKGRVIAQSVKAGKTRTKGAKVNLVVSTGQKKK